VEERRRSKRKAFDREDLKALWTLSEREGYDPKRLAKLFQVGTNTIYSRLKGIRTRMGGNLGNQFENVIS